MLVTLLMAIAATGTASDGLSNAERRTLERTLICPERLKDDAARIANTERFIARYAAFAPASRSGTRLRLRDAILAKKRCKRSGPHVEFTVPES